MPPCYPSRLRHERVAVPTRRSLSRGQRGAKLAQAAPHIGRQRRARRALPNWGHSRECDSGNSRPGSGGLIGEAPQVSRRIAAQPALQRFAFERFGCWGPEQPGPDRKSAALKTFAEPSQALHDVLHHGAEARRDDGRHPAQPERLEACLARVRVV